VTITPRATRASERRRIAAALIALALAVCAPATHAYVGPGAGFALLSSFFVLFTTIVVVLLSILAWPVRALWRIATGRVAPPASIRRLVIVGFDGQDPALTDRFLAEGRLPHFKRLASDGSYRRLRTTFPSVSPVAWSSFSTGCQPARHNIYDFIEPDRRTYLPVLSSARVGAVDRVLKIGRFLIPLGRPDLRLLRKSKPFWTILGEHRIWSTILRVPVTFPPDRFYGAELSAMGVPDLLGTQGTFVLFTTRPTGGPGNADSGLRIALPAGRDVIETSVPGPSNPYRVGAPSMALPIRLTIDRARQRVRVDVGDAAIDLVPGRLSPWVALPFRAAPGVMVHGLSRLLVTELDEHVSLYLSPINLDPERPAMPISHPSFYATYLAKRVGPFATLGLAEDTSALNDGVTDDGTFLTQTRDIDAEREAMLLAGLDRLKRGALVCVFDATDRVQHMFWRDIDPGHPAGRGREAAPHRHAIREQYERNDALLGRLRERLTDDDVLMVISDHGFSSFRRGINLNSWLLDEGYLALRPGATGRAEWLRDVDWSKTRAYCLGLTGMFINLAGREKQGTVAPAEAATLKAEIQGKLNGFRDVETGEVGIREAFDPAALYAGPYLENAPDLLIGYNAGYRTSWACAQGVVAGPVFQDNARPWSGDHCIDPRLVPGVFFCNRRTATEDPALIDIAPTALRLFGIEPPPHMDGRPLAGLS
jgi:predicted AlkP superfamily phosphohydrolase/phosphomutase